MENNWQPILTSVIALGVVAPQMYPWELLPLNTVPKIMYYTGRNLLQHKEYNYPKYVYLFSFTKEQYPSVDNLSVFNHCLN